MTTIVLPPPPGEPPVVEGEPAVATSWAQVLIEAAGVADARAEWVLGEGLAPVTDGTWRGPASQAYAEHARTPARSLDAGAYALRSASTAVDAYGETLTTLLERRADLVDLRARLAGDLIDLGARARLALAGSDVEPGAVGALRAEADDLRARVRSYDDVGAQLRTDTIAAEDALVRALDGLNGVERARARLDAAGGTDPALVSATGKIEESLPGFFSGNAEPSDVAAFWEGLTAAERDALVAEYPHLVGGLDGVPADGRDAANRVLLTTDLATLEAKEADGTITDAERDALDNARAVRSGIDDIEGGQDPVTFDPLVAQLYGYDPTAFGGDGRALLGVGDLTTAEDVAFNVPGYSTTVGDSLVSNTGNAVNLYDESRYAEPGGSVASLVWIGYDAPDHSTGDLLSDAAGVATEGAARDGGALLARDLDGYLASRGGSEPHVTVVGHSYGSTTTGYAASDDDLAADDVVLIGSPGAGGDNRHVSDLGIDDDRVYVGAASSDGVTYLGSEGWVGAGTVGVGLGWDPASDDFGATRFRAEDVERGLVPTDHSHYYDPGEEALTNMAAVVTGNPGDVVTADHRYDPWYDDPRDPERGREPTTPRSR